jgi:hypothetical protein
MTGAEVGRLQQGAYPQHILIPDARSVEGLGAFHGPL